MPPMRQPTPQGAEYEWHRRQLAGARQMLFMNDPHPGWYWMRRVRNGPKVPVKIELIRPVDAETGELIADEYLRAWAGTEQVDPNEVWIACANKPIPEAEYRYLMGVTVWDKAYAPQNPYANPAAPVDHLKTPPAF